MASREDKKAVAEFNDHHYYLPPELWPEILIRLPVKALVKFRCVSKSWRSFIESPDFALQNMTHNPENAKDHIVAVGKRAPLKKLRAQIRNGNNYAKIDQVGLGFDSYEKTSVEGCVNGVFCFKLFSSGRLIEIGLSNPSIRKSLRVPLPNMCISNEYPNTENTDDDEPHHYVSLFVDVSIGYDYVRNDIKLLAVRYPVYYFEVRGYLHTGAPMFAEVYGVSERSWRSINVGDMKEVYYRPWSDSKKVFVNGAVHWALSHKDIGLKYARAVAFDMGKEVFTYLALPEIGEQGRFVTRVLVVVEELLGVMEMFDSHVNLWVMKQYGVQESWAKLYKVELSLGIPEFVYLNKDGDVLFMKSSYPEVRLMSCNVRTSKTKRVAKFFSHSNFTYVESMFLLGLSVAY